MRRSDADNLSAAEEEVFDDQAFLRIADVAKRSENF